MTVELQERPEVRVPQALLDEVIRRYAPRQVILFGSRARGEAEPDSDWDLFVILDDEAAPAEGDGSQAARRCSEANVITCRRSVFEAKRDVVGSLANMADEDGIIVWRRSGLLPEGRRRRRVVSRAEQRREARAWLERVERDLRVAQLLVAADPDLLENAAFHLQQTAEKILKGLLTAKASPFRKVHALDELAERAARFFPELTPNLDGLDPYTIWVVAGRYSHAPDEGAPITRENVETLLRRCEALLAKARGLAAEG